MISLERFKQAQKNLEGTSLRSPLVFNAFLSEKYGMDVWLKREDLQPVRSYKIRGAFNKISSLSPQQLINGVVCASAGNHAQGVAYSCNKLKVKGVIFMPATTPAQKVKQVKLFGKDQVEVVLVGDTFDDAFATAMTYCKEKGSEFIHPFDDEKVIEGQGTVGLEILEDLKEKIDLVLCPIGGGGLASGVSEVFKNLSPATKIIGVEPMGAPSMLEAIKAGHPVTLDTIDKFVDGAAVKRVGDLTFQICSKNLAEVVLVPEGKICTEMMRLYNEEALVVEPAGALTLAALDMNKDRWKGLRVVCVVSGSNNDITRTEEIKERSLLFEGLKHYFIVSFPQRAGALRTFLNDVLGPNDDITYFSYQKKTSKEQGPTIIGIELTNNQDFSGLIERLKKTGFNYEYLNEKPELLTYLV